MKKICFVCLGNTCRSPMAEKIFNDLIKAKGKSKLKATSVGISCENGINMDIKSKRALKKLGYNAGAKKSNRLVNLDKNTIYVTMTNQEKLFLNSKNVICFSDMATCQQIPDPFGGGQDVYDVTAKNIEYNVKVLIEKLEKFL